MISHDLQTFLMVFSIRCSTYNYCTYMYIPVFSLGYKSSESQPHPLTTPIIYTLITLAACIVVQLRHYTCRSSIKQPEIAKIQPIQRTKLSPIQFLTNLEIYKTFHHPTIATQLYLHLSEGFEMLAHLETHWIETASSSVFSSTILHVVN